MGDNGRPSPTTTKAPPGQTINLLTPTHVHQSRDTPAPPSGARPAPSGQDPSPVTPFKPSSLSRKLLANAAPPHARDWLRQTTSASFNSTALVSRMCFLPCFSPLTEGPPSDCVALQDPSSSKRFLPTFCSFKPFAPPVASPRVACYVSKNLCKILHYYHSFPQKQMTLWRQMFLLRKAVLAPNVPA